VTDRPTPWEGAFNYLADLADAKLNAAEYASKVRKLYDVLIEVGGDPAEVRGFLLFQVSLGRSISQRHRSLVAKLLPKTRRPTRGRPKGALGDEAYKKRYQLYVDWIYEKTLNPFLTKEQFVKTRLGITEDQYGADFDLDDPDADGPLHKKVNALLQDLKPARLKQLDEGQRRTLETIYPLVIMYPQFLARSWREAKQRCPELTKEDFLRDEVFMWRRDVKPFPWEAEQIRDFLKRLAEGEKQLADSERASLTKIKKRDPPRQKGKRNRAR
jgi:hypothetical protein